jgi:hypothetical protein
VNLLGPTTLLIFVDKNKTMDQLLNSTGFCQQFVNNRNYICIHEKTNNRSSDEAQGRGTR